VLSSSSDIVTVETRLFKGQLGLATRAQVLEFGLTATQVRTALGQGRWLSPARGLYAMASWPDGPARRLLAGCLLTGGVASHRSAAWLWALLRDEPDHISVSVDARQTPTVPAAKQRRPRARETVPIVHALPIVVHRSRDLTNSCLSNWRGVPTTNPLRTLVDVAGDAPPALLNEALDAALSSRLVTVDGLIAEATRLKRPGRRGPAALLKCLTDRGFAGALSPSVLESRTLRLLAAAHIEVEGCEVVIRDLGYRLDIQITSQLFVEVDGYAYHWSPDQKRYDDARRNKLRLSGLTILVYDWHTVVNDPGRLVAEVKRVIGTPTNARRRRARRSRPSGVSYLRPV
jgi:hypothetical protein